MHSTFDHGLKGHLISLLRDIPVDRRVQDQWRLPKLVGYICSVAKRFHGTGNLTPTTTPRELQPNRGSRTNHGSNTGQPVRSLDAAQPHTDEPNVPMRAIDTTASSPAPLLDIRQTNLIDDLDIYAAICEISLQNQRSCDLCGSHDHLIASCPRLVRLLKDPVACKRVLNTISRHVPSGGGPSTPIFPAPTRRDATPPRNNRSQPIRALLQDDDTDTDNTANDTDDGDDADFR